MKRGICIILAFLMLPLVGFIPSIPADTSNLIEAGVTDEFDEELIFWQKMNDGTIMTIDTKGNLPILEVTNCKMLVLLLKHFEDNLRVFQAHYQRNND